MRTSDGTANFEFLKFRNAMSANGGGDCSSASCSSPEQRSESRGSSVSAGLREEYEDLLKYAVVAPKLLNDGANLPPILPPTPSTEEKGEANFMRIV